MLQHTQIIDSLDRSFPSFSRTISIYICQWNPFLPRGGVSVILGCDSVEIGTCFFCVPFSVIRESCGKMLSICISAASYTDEPFLFHEFGIERHSNPSLFDSCVFSVGCRQNPHLQYTIPFVQRVTQRGYWILVEISHISKNSTFLMLWIMSFDFSLNGCTLDFDEDQLSAPLGFGAFRSDQSIS